MPKRERPVGVVRVRPGVRLSHRSGLLRARKRDVAHRGGRVPGPFEEQPRRRMQPDALGEGRLRAGVSDDRRVHQWDEVQLARLQPRRLLHLEFARAHPVRPAGRSTLQLHRAHAMSRLAVRGAWPCAVLLSALGVVGCGKSSSGGFDDDDASSGQQGEDGSSPSSSGSPSFGSSSSSGSGTGSSSSGSHGSSGSGSGSSGGSSASTARVVSSVVYTDGGVPVCGSTPCDLTSNVCCVSAQGDGSCLKAGSTCPDTVILGSSFPQAQFDCLQASDCPAGDVCCGVATDATNTASAGSNCQDISSTGQCSPVASGSQSKSGSAQLCQTDAECKNKQTCQWQVCDVQTPYGAASPNLTMCGPQTGAPFNCKACPGSSNCATQAP